MTGLTRTLAIECATEACSAALFEAATLIEGRYTVLGRGHAERLVPLIAELPGKGRADRIIVSLGPGSFTGVRIGLAAARALGLAWGVPVLGYPTLALICAMAQAAHPDQAVTMCMAGGHGEYFVQNFSAAGVAEDSVRSLVPADAAKACHHPLIAGNRAEAIAALLGDGREAIDMLPDARQAMLLDEAALSCELVPIYGRGPDAKLPESRA